MKALQLLDQATQSFGPAAMKVIGRAFDEAWAGLAGNIAGSAESARLQLATIVLSIATDDSRDVEALKAAALKIMRRAHHTLL